MPTATKPDASSAAPINLADARHALTASFLGWMLDACDFFIVLFTLDNVAQSFGASIGAILLAPTLTLLTRPIGAYLCGGAADRHGRKPVIMATIVVYSLIEIASAYAPSLTIFLALRALFGVALGGFWGTATSLVMESVPSSWRGGASGLLQAGYPAGYLLASLLFLLLPVVGWRTLYVIGASAIFVALYIAVRVPESPEWRARQAATAAGRTAGEKAPGLWTVIRTNPALCVFAVALMTSFTFLSHGSEDLYPKLFLGLERHLPATTITTIVVLYNITSIMGGLAFGALSQRIGRQYAIATAALACLPLLPLSTVPHSAVWLAIGACALQFCVQGAWGVVPAYLSELSPAAVRATFPGLAYQCGNLLSASNAQIQHGIALATGWGLGPAMIIVVGGAAIAIAVLTLLNARLHPNSVIKAR